MGIFSFFNAQKGLSKAQRRSQKLKVLWTLMGVTAASAGSAVVMDISTRVDSPNTRLMLQSAVVFWCFFIFKIVQVFVWGAEDDATADKEPRDGSAGGRPKPTGRRPIIKNR